MTSRTLRSRMPRAPRPRRGVSLVELLVALTLLTTGLLAIVGTSGAIARSLGESRSDNLAAMVAQSRFELTAGTACTSLTLDSWTTTATRNVSEKWRVTDGGNNTRLITDSISWTTREGTRRQVFVTLIPCRVGA